MLPLAKANSRLHPLKGLNSFWIIAIAIIFVNVLYSSVSGASLKNDSNETPHATLELQPPFADDDDDSNKSIDSYGNPIEYSKPIETPDGRKVISAKGLQFEIPTYASGITEFRKPADDLLPPFIDPIAVALPDWDAPQTEMTTTAAAVEIENAHIVELSTTKVPSSHKSRLPNRTTNSDAVQAGVELFTGIPTWLSDNKDPNVGPGVPYEPQNNKPGLNVLSWDLLPPQDTDPFVYTSENAPARFTVQPTHEQTQDNAKIIRVSLTPGQSVGIRNHQFLFTTDVPTTTTATAEVTMTEKPITTSILTTTTTPTTTTTRSSKTFTSKSAPPATTTLPTSSLSDDKFLMLPGGDSFTLPPWLADVDDPELSVAVTFEVPTDNNEYNHTVFKDLLPPLKPFVDLTPINFPSSFSSSVGHTMTIPPTTKPAASFSPSPTRTSAPKSAHPQPWNVFHFTSTKRTQQHQQQNTTAPPAPVINDRHQTHSASNSQFHVAPTTSYKFTSTSTTQKPQRVTQYTNVQQSSTVGAEQAAESIGPSQVANSRSDPFKSNPFFSLSTIPNAAGGSGTANVFNHQQPKPFSSSFFQHNQQPGRPFGATTTTTTTTTTPSPKTYPEIYENPFDSATIPPWLRDFNDPDVGPGVPFIFEQENSSSSPVYNDLLAPSSNIGTDGGGQASIPSVVIAVDTSNPFLRPFLKPNIPQQSNSDSPFRKAVTLSTPHSPQYSSFGNFGTHPVTEPSKLFTPPPVHNIPSSVDAAAGKESVKEQRPTNFNNRFAAPFDQSSTDSSPAAFPPVTSKTTFSKSDDGKVISKNGFATTPQPSQQTKPFDTGFNSSPKGSIFPTNNQFSSTTLPGFLPQKTTSGSAVGFGQSPLSPAATSNNGKYTGGFGGAPGFLGGQKTPGYAVQADGSIRDPDHTYRPPTAQVVAAASSPQASLAPAIAGAPPRPVASALPSDPAPVTGPSAVGADTTVNSGHKYKGTFGGPPGVLIPYDNINGAKQ